METITLHKSKFDSFANVLDNLCASFGNYDATIDNLKHTASAVDSSTCNLDDVINDIANSQESKKEKVERAKKLNKKLTTFVNAAIQHEKDAAAEIRKEKNKFYKDYDYLRPDCERSLLERIGRWVSRVGEAIKEWIADNIIAIIVAAVIIIAAILIVVFAPAICAIAAVIVAALSAVMGIVDIICTIATGDDFATWLDKKGCHVLSQIWKGASWGFTIASLILPIGAMEEAGKAALKESLKHPFKALGGMFKDGAKGLKLGLTGLKNTFAKDGFKAGMKAIGKGLGKTALSILGFDDLKNGFQLGKAFFQHKSFHEMDNMCMKMLGLGGAKLTGAHRNNQYDDLVGLNNKGLTNAVTDGNVGTKNAFSEMNFEFKPESGSNAANMLNDVRAGNASASSLAGDMKDDFFNALKNDGSLSKKLADATGVDISNCTDAAGLKRALEGNGFTLNTHIGTGADGKAVVDVVPQWASKATNVDGHGAMKIMTAGHDYGFSSKNTVKMYERFVNTKNAIAGGDLGNKIIGTVFDKTMDLGIEGAKIADFDFGKEKFENTFGFKVDDHPIIKDLVISRFTGSPSWMKEFDIKGHFVDDTMKAIPGVIHTAIAGSN